MHSYKFLAPFFILPFLLAGCGAGTVPTDESQASSSAVSQQSQDIVISSPAAGAAVTSPLTVTGEARGTWYFEGSFPIQVLDDQGTQIGMGIAQAEGEWMTGEFVPFTATVEFTTTATQGSLVIEKDNPSGEPENAAQIIVPVQF